MSDSNKTRSSMHRQSAISRTAAEIEAMEAELLASIEAFSARDALPTEDLPQKSQEQYGPLSRFPEIVPDSAQAARHVPEPPQPAPRPEMPPPPAAATEAPGDLLAELREAASQAITEDEQEARRRAEKDKAMGVAMRQIFDYVNELARHLDTLKPQVSHLYRLSPQIQFAGLHWSDSFVDYRTLGNSEYANLDSVSLRFTLASEQSVTVVPPANQVARLQDELVQVGIRYSMTDRKNDRGAVEAVEFHLTQEVKVSLLFKAQTEMDRIVIRGRNFRGFGPAAYALAPAEVNKAMLDELGRFLIGRPSRIFSHLQPLAL